jgi:hypothetical protein
MIGFVFGDVRDYDSLGISELLLYSRLFLFLLGYLHNDGYYVQPRVQPGSNSSQ